MDVLTNKPMHLQYIPNTFGTKAAQTNATTNALSKRLQSKPK